MSVWRRKYTPSRHEAKSLQRRRLSVENLEDRCLLSIGTAGPIGFDALQIDPQSYDPSHILVGFREDAPTTVGVDGTRLTRGGNLWKVPVGEGRSVGQAIASFQGRNDVLFAEPDYRVSIAATFEDPFYDNLWGLNNTGQTGGTFDADIDAPEAWEVTTGSSSTLVAVIDTGIDYTHPDLAANIWTNPGEIPGDGIDNDGNGFVDDVHGYDFVNNDGDPMDDHGHGTHVAGTIGALNNGIGVVGVSPNVQLMAVKFLGASGSGYLTDAIRGLDYAVQMGAKISNNSWTGGGFTQSLYDAIERAQQAGHIFVAAAGNDGQDAELIPVYPAAYDLGNIVSVAATDHNDDLAWFSNYGSTTVDLSAPGVSILSTMPGNNYGYFNGTSMATPHVVGVVSLVHGLHPEWTYREVVDQVLSTVDPVSSLTGKTLTGGRLNAAEAVGNGPAPYVVSHSPREYVVGPISSVDFTFSKAIQPGTFTAEDIVSFTGPDGTDLRSTITGVNGSGTTSNVRFASQSALGSYRMVIGPSILDRSSQPLDQDGDAVYGETPDDQYTATFQIAEEFVFQNSAGFVSITDARPAIQPVIVDQDMTIADLDVQVNLSHSWDSQLDIYLVPPGEDVSSGLPLALRRGEWGNDFWGTIFDDEANLPISAGQPPFSGRFRPEQLLSRYDGLNARGRWELWVYDREPGDTGTLYNWSLIVKESSSDTGDTTAPSVIVQTPNGGQDCTVGTVEHITWNASDNVGVTAVDLHYSTDGGSSFTPIAQNEPNDGSYTWTVPNAPTDSAVVKVVARDAVGNQGSDVSDATFSIVAEATPGIIVTPTSGLETTEVGGTATFDVVLESQPTADVTIGISSSDMTEGTTSATSLTFSSGNWDTPQTVAVTGVDDAEVDGDVAYAIIMGPASSTDDNYNGLNAANVSVTNLDDDVLPKPPAGITVTPTSGLTTSESGATASFSIVLDSPPTSAVTVAVTSSNPSEGTVSTSASGSQVAEVGLTFTSANWDIPLTVTVTGVDDTLLDGDIDYSVVTAPAISTDPGYSDLDPADVSVTNEDNEVPLPDPGLTADRFESNDSLAAATNFGKMNNREELGLTIHDTADKDFFRFSVNKSATFLISTLFAHADGNLDLIVFDGQGDVVGQSTSSTDNESVAVELTRGREYVVEVFSPSGEVNGYDLSILKMGKPRRRVSTLAASETLSSASAETVWDDLAATRNRVTDAAFTDRSDKTSSGLLLAELLDELARDQIDR